MERSSDSFISNSQLAGLSLAGGLVTAAAGVVYLRQAGGRTWSLVRLLRTEWRAHAGESQAGHTHSTSDMSQLLRSVADWPSTSAQPVATAGALVGAGAAVVLTKRQVEAGASMPRVAMSAVPAGLLLVAAGASLYRPSIPGLALLDTVGRALGITKPGTAMASSLWPTHMRVPSLVQGTVSMVIKALPTETKAAIRGAVQQAQEGVEAEIQGAAARTRAGSAAAGLLHEAEQLSNSAWMAGPGIMLASGLGTASAALVLPLVLVR